MAKTLATHRPQISPFAPRLLTIHVNPEKIGKIIGPGGKTIKAIVERTGAKIDIEDDGTVFISAIGMEAAEKAREEIERLAEEVKIGKIYNGKVTSIKDFGAFIEVIPGQDGLCHISASFPTGSSRASADEVKMGQNVARQGHRHRRPGPHQALTQAGSARKPPPRPRVPASARRRPRADAREFLISAAIGLRSWDSPDSRALNTPITRDESSRTTDCGPSLKPLWQVRRFVLCLPATRTDQIVGQPPPRITIAPFVFS